MGKLIVESIKRFFKKMEVCRNKCISIKRFLKENSKEESSIVNELSLNSYYIDSVYKFLLSQGYVFENMGSIIIKKDKRFDGSYF